MIVHLVMKRLERAVVMQVLGQYTRYRGSTLEFVAANGVYIVSKESPELSRKVGNPEIFLWGYTEQRDMAPDVKRFATNEERDEYVKIIYEALTEFAEAGGWRLCPYVAGGIWSFTPKEAPLMTTVQVVPGDNSGTVAGYRNENGEWCIYTNKSRSTRVKTIKAWAPMVPLHKETMPEGQTWESEEWVF